MNQYVDRQLISQFVITVGVCVFGWIMIVQPMSSELNDLNKQLVEAKSHTVLLEQLAIETMANKMDGARQQVIQIKSKNRFAADTSRRYSLIMNLASKYHVIIHRLDPGSAGQDENNNSNVQSTRFDMSAEGKYQNLSHFLNAINEIDGFVKLMSLTVSPKGYKHQELVDARITCEVLAFSLPTQLAAMAGVQANEQ